VAVAIENASLYEDISKRETRYRNELAIARRTQEGLFPEEPPPGDHWEASAHFIPARELAGDLFDFYHVDDEQLGVCVGDVAGKGIPAALLGAVTSGTIRGRAFQGASPNKVLFRANRTLIRRAGGGLYCALTYAHFDFQKREVRIASSGLPYTIHYRAAEKKAAPIVLPGIPLGLFDDVEYDEVTIPLESGDTFVFHSDGVSEAWNGSEEFGTTRLLELVEKSGHRSPTDLGNEIEDTLRDWAKEHLANDDATFVILRVV